MAEESPGTYSFFASSAVTPEIGAELLPRILLVSRTIQVSPDSEMDPSTRSSKRLADGSVKSADRYLEESASSDGYSDLSSVGTLPDSAIMDTDLGSMQAETSDGISISLDEEEVSSIDPAAIDIAIDVIKRTCDEVGFESKGKVYYGVGVAGLGDLLPLKRPAIRLAVNLEKVVVACDGAGVPQYRLKKALSRFKGASANKGVPKSDNGRLQVYYGHARRMLARLTVLYQGYFAVHLDEVSTFKSVCGVGQRRTKPPPAGITELYTTYNPEWSPLRILTWQLSGLSEALSKRVAKLLRPISFTQTQWSTDSRIHRSAMVSDDLATGAGRSGLSVRRATRNTKRTSSMNSTKCHLTASTESVETRPKNSVTKLLNRVWPLSSRTVLEGLASSCLQDDLPSTQGKAMIKRLVSERQLRQLRENHKQYLTEILLRGLDQGDQGPYTYLAVLLGFFDWIRANEIDAEAVLPSPDDNGGELYEELYPRGIALTLQPQGI